MFGIKSQDEPLTSDVIKNDNTLDNIGQFDPSKSKFNTIQDENEDGEIIDQMFRET